MIFGKWINRYYKKYWYLFLAGILALILVDYAQLMVPEILGDLINQLKATGTFTSEMIWKPVVSILLIGFFIFLGRFVWRLTILRAGFRVEADLRQEMFLHAEKLSLRYFQEQKVGALMALFTNDLEMISQVVSDGTIFTIDAFFLGGMAFVKMFLSNWKLSIVATIPLLVLVALGGVVGKAMELRQKECQEAYERLSDFTQENFTGISIIKAFVKEVQEFRSFSYRNQDIKKANIAYVRYGVILDILIDLLIYTIGALIMAIGGYYVINGQNFNAGDVTEFSGYFTTIIWPMLALAQIINLRSRGNASLNRIAKLLEEKPEIVDASEALQEPLQGEITMKHLYFSYPGSFEPTLKDISLHIEKGETIGIVGKIGSGKTTLVQLLLRLYNVDKDQLFFDERDIMDISLDVLRKDIGYVPQDQFLFSGTIASHISFGKMDASEEEISKAARFAEVEENILSFPEGYQTVSGERGVTLSGGQKQRIALARAVIKDPTILILDDVVSAVDVKTEEQILHHIEEERRGKTTIIVASRVSTVRHAHRILVLRHGKVEAFADHDTLMETSKTYRRMVELQELEKEMEER